MFDVLAAAKAEASGKDISASLRQVFSVSNYVVPGHHDADVLQAGVWRHDVKPVVHALTDAYALLGTVAAVDIFQLPCYGVPMWAQYRQDTQLASLAWFGAMPYTCIKWSTAGDAMVRLPSGEKKVVMGKSGNAPLRTQSGVFCNERSYGPVTVIRCMPCLPYSQDRAKFYVNDEGMVHSEMNTPGVQLAYANRYFLQRVHETGAVGRVAMKPTQSMEDGINAGLHAWMLRKTACTVGRKYAVDPYEEHKVAVDKIIALLPENFTQGMERWTGHIEQHISDTNYGILVWDMIKDTSSIVLATDLDGDRLTDLLADISDPLRAFARKVAKHVGSDIDEHALWKALGYRTGNGRDMMSIMHRMHGPVIYEQTLGSADAMLLRLLQGDETLGGSKQPYDPRIHFVLMREAYKAANPDHRRLHAWLDDVMITFDQVYAPGKKRPGFLEGYHELKSRIVPWGG